MFFSDKLRLLRTQANLSQEDLADELHVSRQSVSKWESGISFPEIEKLISISDYFHVSLDAFCTKFSSRVSRPYLIYTKDLRKEGNLLYLPVYMTMFL